MVINLLEIQPGATSIIASVSVDSGNTVVKALAWNKDTYQDESKAIDLTSLLSGLDENEDFSITAEALGVGQITGLWAVEFFSSASPGYRTDQPAEEPSKTGIVVNLLPYYECLLDKSMELVVKGCSVMQNSCGKGDNLNLASTLLETSVDAITFGLYDEAIQIINTIECMCEVCTACPNYGDDLSQDGYGFKTVNDIVTLT